MLQLNCRCSSTSVAHDVSSRIELLYTFFKFYLCINRRHQRLVSLFLEIFKNWLNRATGTGQCQIFLWFKQGTGLGEDLGSLPTSVTSGASLRSVMLSMHQ